MDLKYSVTFTYLNSSYPKYEGVGEIKKDCFIVIARNLLNNKKLPSP